MYLDLPRILYLYWIWHYLIHILIKAKKEPKMFWKISLTDIGDISTWWWKKCSRICGEMFFKLTLHTRTCQTKNTKPPKYIWWKTMVGTGHFLRFIHSWKNMTHINPKEKSNHVWKHVWFFLVRITHVIPSLSCPGVLDKT